jgi:hypothetical protein
VDVLVDEIESAVESVLDGAYSVELSIVRPHHCAVVAYEFVTAVTEVPQLGLVQRTLLLSLPVISGTHAGLKGLHHLGIGEVACNGLSHGRIPLSFRTLLRTIEIALHFLRRYERSVLLLLGPG